MTVRTIPVGALGCDFWALTDAIKQWILDNDVRVVFRYFTPRHQSTKAIKVDELNWYAAHNVAVVPLWEISSTEWRGGAAAGKRAGMFLRDIGAEFGIPTDVPMIPSVDSGVTDAEVPLAAEFILACVQAQAPYSPGYYGPDKVMAAIAAVNPFFFGPNAKSWMTAGVKPHAQQHLTTFPPNVDQIDVLAPFDAWLPPGGLVEPTLYPTGYKAQMVPMPELKLIHRFDLMEPEFARRLENWLRAQGGKVGIGNAYRSTQPVGVGYAEAGSSFHEINEFADGSRWFSAADLVVVSPGGNHRAPTPTEAPQQGSAWATEYGVHINVGDSSMTYPAYESWHMQPVELDGHGEWLGNGRPRPKVNYPIPDLIPDPPAPEEEEVAEKFVNITGKVPVGVYGWPSGSPAVLGLFDTIDATVTADDAYMFARKIAAVLDWDDAFVSLFNSAVKDATKKLVPPDGPTVTVDVPPVQFPASMNVAVKSLPVQTAATKVEVVGQVDID